ncbi:hypothetical protein J6590_054923 [Homalodisca vitripennis]|nr:hypothetical protein J6590_054923 [Homalodisca vitripennis]
MYKKRPYDERFKHYFNSYCETSKKRTLLRPKTLIIPNKISKCDGDVSGQWKIIKSLTGVSKGKSVDKVILDNGEVITDSKELAREINSYLISAESVKLAQGLQADNHFPLNTEGSDGDHLGSPLHVRAGVPQGSVLSDALFLIFINDLLKLNFHGSMCAFADDVAFLYSRQDKQLTQAHACNDLFLLRRVFVAPRGRRVCGYCGVGRGRGYHTDKRIH